MRTSIMLNPAALQAELFAMCFHFKPLETRFGSFIIEPSISGEKLILNVYSERDLIAAFEISRDTHPELRSTEINDYHKFFMRQFRSVQDYFDRGMPIWSDEIVCIKEFNYSKSAISPESILNAEWFNMDHQPDRKNESGEYTDDVLIDLTGERKHFAVGYLIFDSESGEEWKFYQEDISILQKEHAKWTYLPLSKYDKK